jgi:hypothetical protein
MKVESLVAHLQALREHNLAVERRNASYLERSGDLERRIAAMETARSLHQFEMLLLDRETGEGER